MTIPCTNLTFQRFQGDTWILPFAVKDANGAPVTVTGFTGVSFGLFEADESEVILLTLDDDPVTITLSTNIIRVVIPYAQTGDLLGQYLFELEIIDDSGYKQTIARGEATALKDLING